MRRISNIICESDARLAERELLVNLIEETPGRKLIALDIGDWECRCGFSARTLVPMFDHVVSEHGLEEQGIDE